MKRILLSISLLTLLFFAGCAFGTAYVSISYIPPTAGPEVKGKNVILMSKTVDKRSDLSADKIGFKRNTYGGATGDIKIEGNRKVEDLLGTSLAGLIKSNGFNVRSIEKSYDIPNEAKEGSIALMKVSINQFMVDMRPGFWAITVIGESNIDVTFLDPYTEKVLWEENIRANAEKGGIQVCTDGDYDEVGKALYQNLMEEAKNKIPWDMLRKLSQKK